LHAYRERVCLIQFSTPETDYLVDALAFEDLGALAPIFANPQSEKIFHDAVYDVLGLHRDHGFTFTNIFDTKVAACALGYASFGLGNMLAEKLGIEVDKRYQKADWARRPLPAEMIDYARLDTHYLFPLRALLEAELMEKGRYELAYEDFVRVCKPLENGRKPPRSYWEKVKGHQALQPEELALLNELSARREDLAAEMDRPVFKVLSDELLITLAQAAPHSREDLVKAGLTERQVDKFGAAFIQAARRGEAAAPIQRTRSRRPSDAVLKRLDKLKAWRKDKAREMQVESDIVLPRTLMQDIAEQGPHNASELSTIMQEAPWRLEHFGPGILQVIAPN